MSSDDFVEARLSAKGQELAASSGGALRVIAGHYQFEFKPGEEQRVTRAIEWERILAREFRDGQPLFELAEKDTGARREKTKPGRNGSAEGGK